MTMFDKYFKKEAASSDVLVQYKIEGTSFDRKTTNGLNNFLSWKSLNSDYFSKRLGYFFVSLASIITSVYGGIVMGTLIFIIAAVMIEAIKLMMGRDKKDIVILASVISLSFALYGLYKTIDTENQSLENKNDQVLVLKNAIESADKQIKALQNGAIEKPTLIKPPVFDQEAYMNLIRTLTKKQSILDGLLKASHINWRKNKPSKYNKRKGSWMIANYDKCTGWYCPKLKAKYDEVQALKKQKAAMEEEKANISMLQEKAMNMESQKAQIEQQKQATIQELINNRNKDQRKLLKLQGKVKVPVDIEFTMTLLFLLLLFVERYQYTTGNRLAQMKSHRLKVNTLHTNYLKKKEEQKPVEEKPQTNRWFSRKGVENTPTVSTDNDQNLSPEAKKVKRALLKVGHNELAVSGRLSSVHIKSILKNRNLEKEINEMREEKETMEKATYKALRRWGVTTSRMRGKELSAEFRKGLL